MSVIDGKKCKCALCGNEDTYYVLYSTNSFGPCDLDTRPAPMARYTLSNQIQTCAQCGYSNYDISKLVFPNAKVIVESQKYQKILSMDLPETAKSFFLLATIAEENKDYRRAGYSLLKAAWDCDDSMETEKAIEFRKKAITNFLKVLEEKEDDGKNDTIKMILLDLYRRTKQFDKVLKFANGITLVEQNDYLSEIIESEIRLSLEKDSKCYQCR